MRRVRLVGALVALVCAVGLSGCSSDKPSDAVPVVTDVNATGRELVTKFLTILQAGDKAALDGFLDDSFQIQRADGSAANKSKYLQNPSQVKSFALGKELTASMNGGVLIVRWSLVVDETINGKEIAKGEAPRLSSFLWHDGAWRLASHANFALPATNEPPVLDDAAAVGRDLARQFITILKNKDGAALGEFLAAAFQIQRADGTGANRLEYLAADISISSFELGPDVTAIQETNTLTVRWSLQIDETVNGEVTGKNLAPRLSTFIWENGAWRLLSHANFNALAADDVPVLADPNTTGRELVLRFAEILQSKDRVALAAFLAGAFQMQRSNGTSTDREEYLALDVNLTNFALGEELEAFQELNALTVRWSVKVVQTVDGKPVSEVFAPRLSTFIWEKGAWRLLSHANFNPPVA